MLVTLARTTQPVKPVLQTKDIAVCVQLDSTVTNVKMVRPKFSATGGRAALFVYLLLLLLFIFIAKTALLCKMVCNNCDTGQSIGDCYAMTARPP